MAKPSLEIGNDKWAIKEDSLLGYGISDGVFVPQPITMTRASAGTRVNSAGLVETVELLGSEEVVNGDFATDTDWIKGTGWTISGGTAILDGTQTGGSSLSSSNMTVTVGKIYKVTVNVSATSSGFRLYDALGVVSYGLTLGENIFYRTPSSSTYTLTPLGLAGATGTISNVSVKEYTANNLARVDYTDGTSSLLVEPQRTNEITYSEDFSDSSWTKNLLTATTNVTTSPNGVINADLIESTTTSSSYISATYPTLTATNTYTFSVFAKKGNNDWIRMAHISSGVNASWFDLENGVVGTVNGISATIEDYGNGWYRCTTTFVTYATSGNLAFIGICDGDNSTNAGASGQNDYIWGAQLELGSYATSYIPTDGTTVTRVQDQYEKTGISDLINSEEGSFFIEMAALNQPPGSQISISLSGDTSSDRILIYSGSGGGSWLVQFRKLVGASPVNLVVLQHTATVTNQSKVAVSWEAGRYVVYVDGTKVTNYTTGSETHSVTFDAGSLKNLQFSPNHNATSNYFNGKVKQLQVYDTALTDSELETLTT